MCVSSISSPSLSLSDVLEEWLEGLAALGVDDDDADDEDDEYEEAGDEVEDLRERFLLGREMFNGDGVARFPGANMLVGVFGVALGVRPAWDEEGEDGLLRFFDFCRFLSFLSFLRFLSFFAMIACQNTSETWVGGIRT